MFKPKNAFLSLSKGCLIFFYLFFISCSKGGNNPSNNQPPVVNVIILTGTVSYNQFDSVTIIGTIQSVSANETIVERGHYFSLNSSLSLPIIDSTKISGEGTVGSFTSYYSNIKSNTIYYITGYAVTKSGKRFYGNTVQFNSNNYLSSLNTGLILYLPFNNNFNDSTSNSNNAIGTNVLFDVDRNNKPNSSISLKTDSSYLQLSKPFDLPNNFSVSYWFFQYNQNPLNSDQTIFSKDSSFVFYNKNDLVGDLFPGFSLFSSSDNSIHDFHLVNTQSPWFFTVGNWYNLTVTYDGNTIILYMNGNFFESFSFVLSAIKMNNNPIYIGKQKQFSNSTGYKSFFGRIDDLRVFNRVLSTNEIEILYKYF